ncbi:tetrathionate reductase subunit A [Salmonella bongori]|nr:tetrathionate reductase subunit A [Salmonella bongori]
MSNPFYGVPGLRAVAEEKLKDPRRLPLFIAIDAFMNETTAPG